MLHTFLSVASLLTLVLQTSAPPLAINPHVTDMLTVSETATEPPQDEGNSINAPRNLALEAKFVNQNFSQQVLKVVSPQSGES